MEEARMDCLGTAVAPFRVPARNKSREPRDKIEADMMQRRRLVPGDYCTEIFLFFSLLRGPAFITEHS